MKAMICNLGEGRVPRSASVFALIEGGLLVLFGLAALCFPALAGIATAVLFGWILIASGVLVWPPRLPEVATRMSGGHCFRQFWPSSLDC